MRWGCSVTNEASAPGALGSNDQLGGLPAPDLTLPSVAPDGPDGAHYYRASTVRRLIEAQRPKQPQWPELETPPTWRQRYRAWRERTGFFMDGLDGGM
jgi:hypothetical protein